MSNGDTPSESDDRLSTWVPNTPRGSAAPPLTPDPVPNDFYKPEDPRLARAGQSIPLAQRMRSIPLTGARVVSFGLIGGFVALVGFVLLYVLVQYAGFNKNVAYFIQSVVSIELNFLLNNSLTWRDRRGTGLKSFAGAWARFHLTRVFTVIFNQILFGALIYIGIYYLIANALCIVIVMTINYFAGDKFVFRARPASSQAVRTIDLLNPDAVTELHLPRVLRPRAIPATGWPSVSVVVPVGRVKGSLEPTVTSLLGQDYPGEIELILVGCRNDPSWEQISWYVEDKLVTIIEAKTSDLPVSTGMKRVAGIGCAHGQIVASLDSGVVVPPSWISSGVECIKSGWPCVVGTTSMFTGTKMQAQSSSTGWSVGQVLDLERFAEATYVPPVAANFFLAGNVLPSIISLHNPEDVYGGDYLQWLWNLARAEIAILETPQIIGVFARLSRRRLMFGYYVEAGVTLARFIRQNASAAVSARQRARLAGAFLAWNGLLVIIAAGLLLPTWPSLLGLPGWQVTLNANRVPAGSVLALAAAACLLAYLIRSSAVAIARTGQRLAAIAPLYRLAYLYSAITAATAGLLQLPRRQAKLAIPRFTLAQAAEEPFTRPLSLKTSTLLRRRSMIPPSTIRNPPGAAAPSWPSVSVIIPVKANQATIHFTVNSLLEQTYRGQVEILLVGDKQDPTWETIRPLIDTDKVRIIEAEINSANRDANAKRTIGLHQAQGEILALTDSDMVLPPHWISTGVQYILRGWPCVGGPMRGASGTFWDAYTDLVALGSKSPRFVLNHVVDKKRFGRPQHKPPITANVFMTRSAWESAGDFDPHFIHSYEDYSWFWVACKAGVPIRCTPTLVANHYHRQGWKRLIHQYTRAGRGCADFITKYPESPFSRFRLSQLLLVAAAGLAGLSALVAGVLATLSLSTLDIAPVFAQITVLTIPLGIFALAAFMATLFVSLLGLGIVNALTVRQLRAAVFPFATLVFGLAFSYGMTLQLITNLRTEAVKQLTVLRAQLVTTLMFTSILIVSAAIRFWNIGTRPGYEWDEPVYTSVGSYFARYGIVEYKAPISKVALYLSHPPFYFVMLGEWFRLVGIGIPQARVFSVLMSLIMITILFLFLYQRMGRWALLPVLLVALDGWIVYTNRISWIDNAVVVFGILGLWAYFHALKVDTPRAYIVASLLLGFTFVFKQLGVYFCAVPVLNWLLSRQRTRGHLIMLGVVGGLAAVYVDIMTILYNTVFIQQTLAQVFRSSGSVTSRGVVSNPGQVIAAITGQYRIFIFTVFLCGASVAWLAVDAVRSIWRRDASWLRLHSLEISWIVVGLVVFMVIQIKFPNYFIYLMIPLLVYLGMRLKEVVAPWLAASVRRTKLLRAGLLLVLLLGIGADLTESYFRFVKQTDNALLQAANFAIAHIPTNDTVLADEPVGVMIPQKYCKLESAASCPDVKWIITYTSLTEHLPTQASDPLLYVLLGESQVVTVIHGFKETIMVYRVGTPPPQSSSPVPVAP